MSLSNLEFTAAKGEKAAIGLQEGSTHVDLTSREVLTIDLSPLKKCLKLQQLALGHNKLKDIDLDPIRGCTDFSVLQLDWNQLHDIDLEPLSECSDLKYLSLSNNDLTELDLSPLQGCSNLVILELDSNQLTTLDLQPISKCTALKALSLSNNQLEDIDLSPIDKIASLQQLILRSNKIASLNLHPLAGCLDIRTIDVSQNGLTSIDLSPLLACKNLQSLGLSENQLSAIDLSPIAEHTSLETLWLGDNQLQEIEIKHLAKMSKLHDIDLSKNQLKSIGLDSIATCSGLQKLRLNGNQIQKIDLWPLVHCKELLEVNLENNPLDQLDINPLYLVRDLTTLTVDESIEFSVETLFKYSERPQWLSETDASKIKWLDFKQCTVPTDWSRVYSSVKRILNHCGERDRFPSQRGLLDWFDMGELGGYDGNPERLLELQSETTDYETTKNLISERMVELLDEQFEKGGPTLFLDIEHLSTTRASILIPRIHELREKEIDEIFIPVIDGMADLRFLWLTYYGFSILTTMGVKGVELNLAMFRKVQAAMERIDVTLRIEHVTSKPEPPSIWGNSSDSIKEYVFKTFARTERWR